MSYGKVKDTFWTDKKVLSFSDDAKMLALYFMTGPHRNLLGCMRVPDGYLMADLGWGQSRLGDAIDMLCDKAFICRDSDGWTLILNQLKHDPIKVPNHVRSAIAIAKEIPGDSIVYKHLLPKLMSALNAMNMASEWDREDIAIPEPEPEPEPEKRTELVLIPPSISLPHPDIEIAFSNYNTLASKLSLPKAEKLTEDRRKNIKRRLAEHGLDGWNRALGKIEHSPFLLGKNDRSWRCNLDFLLQTESFNKVLDGAYENARGSRAVTPLGVGG